MSNPHRISIFLILLLFLGLIFVAVSDLLSFHEDDFDLSEALVQGQVQTPRHYDSSDVEEPVNYLLASKRRILDVSSEYFVFLKLNVNLHTPCDLYYYNQQIGKLIELYSFNDRELLGLHVMSVERLKGLE